MFKDLIGKIVEIYYGENDVDENEITNELIIMGKVTEIDGNWLFLDQTDETTVININHIVYVSIPKQAKPKTEQPKDTKKPHTPTFHVIQVEKDPNYRHDPDHDGLIH